jgi:hypothetical protein
MLEAGVGNYLQLFGMLDFEGTETSWNLYSKFLITCFIQLLPYVGFHSKNPVLNCNTCLRGWIKYKPTSAFNFLLKRNFTK